MATEEPGRSLGYTPTWVVTVVCFVIVLLSFMAERGLHRLGKFFKHKKQDSLYDALEKVKEELMLLGFISLLLTVFQGAISNICIPVSAASVMLPCKPPNDQNLSSGGSEHLSTVNHINRRRLLAEDNSMEKCTHKGMLPLLSLEALHQLHIFIFVLAVVHVIFCVSTMLLGGLKIRRWRHWENSIRNEITKAPNALEAHHSIHIHHRKFMERAGNYWRKFRVVSWTVAFFKQFYGSVTKSDYIILRTGFIRAHCPTMPNFDFHKYMMRTLELDFKKIVGISWYLWIFVMIFLLVNLAGWHSYFWLSFLPLILLLLVGAKLEHIITKLAKEVAENSERGGGRVDANANTSVKPSDELFWFHRPALVLYLIHFILFQNSFEMAFLFWVWTTYGFRSCVMEDLGFIIPRIVVGVIVQVLCSYSTLPLYALVTQMGSMFKQGMFDEYIQGLILDWARGGRRGGRSSHMDDSNRLSVGPFENPIYVTHHQSNNIIEDQDYHHCVETSIIEFTS